MKTNRKALCEILQAVRAGVASKETVENATAFIFCGDRVLTYNDEIAVSHPIDIDLVGAVPAKEFEKLLSKLPDEDVDLEVEGNELIVRGHKTRAGVPLHANTNTEEITAMLGDPDDWKGLPETFRPCVDFAAFSAGKDMNKPLLTCIYVGGKDVMSSDDRRVTVCDMGEDADVTPFCLPAVAAKELKAFLPTEYAFTQGWIHFRTKDNVMFSSRRMEGNFPSDKIKEYVKNASKGEDVKLPTTLIDALDRTGIFTKADRVDVRIAEGFLTVRGEGETGWCEEDARIRYSGPDLDFSISPDFLRAILQHTQDATISQSMLKFTGLGFVHLMAVKPSTKPVEKRQEPQPERNTSRRSEPEFNPDDEIPF